MAVLLMNTLILLATAVSVSADSFFCGLSLAVKSKNFFITVIGIAFSVLVLCVCGSVLGKIFGDFLKNYAEILGGIILLVVGLIGLFSKKDKQKEKSSATDFNKSLLLGFTVGLDGAVGSFTLTCSGYNGLFVALLITAIHVVLLIIAVILAKFIRKKLPSDSKFPSVILVVLGLYKLLF